MRGESVRRSPGNRMVRINDSLFNAARQFPSNAVHTAKYTLVTFVPKNLFEQFRRVANIYFLLISVLTCMSFSPKNPTSLIATFILVLTFTAVKEGYEDYLRHQMDREINARAVSVITAANEQNSMQQKDGTVFYSKSIRWDEVKVGDMLYLEKDKEVPADCLLLTSSDTQCGICSIDTANLDGESNLKTIFAVQNGLSAKELGNLQGRVEYEPPNPSLLSFRGSLYLSNASILITLSQMLYRGSVVRHTKWAIALVLYTGHETKAFLNSSKPPYKCSAVMNTMNRCLYFVFFLQAMLCIFNATSLLVWERHHLLPYLVNTVNETTPVSLSEGVEAYFTFIVAYSNLIPISLYVGIEVMKLLQKYLIENDIDMVAKGAFAKSRTSNLVEELGQVEYIFSDKTGTLTCNEMVFLACAIAGVNKCFHFDAYVNADRSTESEQKSPKLTPALARSPSGHLPFPFLGSPAWDALYSVPFTSKITNFWLCLALCHTVVPEHDAEFPQDMMSITFQASSPDEGAIVTAARNIGFVFKSRTATTITLYNNVTMTDETYTILNVLEFSSARRCMSIIVRTPSNTIRIFSKGADTAILSRLCETDSGDLTWTWNQLRNFGEDGLRTLCVAFRDVSHAEYLAWHGRFQEVTMNPDKDNDEHEELIARVQNGIERELELLGVTAIEDKLQSGVPEAIDVLLRAGIRIWVLTGDKEETAINIGHSCNLLEQESQMMLHRLSKCTTEEDLYEYIWELLELRDKISKKEVLVIDGDALCLAMLPSIQSAFLELALRCSACICCRVSPKQKAQIVRMVRDNLPVITLAIGDGANDVNMIQTAHVGIGISGHEGTQAVRASDYSIAQFRFLSKLLLIHGAWGYHRISKFILYYFYKNMLVVFTEYWFAWVSGFSGQIYFPDMLSLGYNALFTSYPCVAGMGLDQHMTMAMVLKHPKLYQTGQRHEAFNERRFFYNLFLALLHSSLCYFVPQAMLSNTISSNGTIGDMWTISVASFVCGILVVSIRMFNKVYTITSIGLYVTIGSILLDLISITALNSTKFALAMQPQMLHTVYVLFSLPRFYLTICLISVASFLFDVFVRYVQKQFYPKPTDILIEQAATLPKTIHQPTKIQPFIPT
ncbi:phospholipid-transporting ATPase 3-like [Thraustotheca clavata]|uniref:Phospholipid-transporting ATPase n=1 Tax=Thraustotheca clavata TaxID=74557 RepID=A0A1W0A6I9_9STRA|nr:phospholipid-transporting ATPase 3-like [Thraustotheca clavata]